MFAPEVYRQRRDRLLKSQFKGLLLFLGNEAVPMNYQDNTYPFRQDSTFRYFFGINIPDLVVVLDGESGESILFGNEPGPEDRIWIQPQPPLSEWAEKALIQEVRTLDELPAYLRKSVEQDRQVLSLPQYRSENTAFMEWLFLENGISVSIEENIRFTERVIALRSKKSDEEVGEIRKALEIAGFFHKAVIQQAKPGMTEMELKGVIEGYVSGQGSQLSYPVILTAHGEILHNSASDYRLQEGDLILNDSGADSPEGYASDITRVFPASKKFSNQQKDVTTIVLKMQSEAIRMLKPGIPYRDVHLHAAKVGVEGLVDLGLMKGDPDEIVATGAYALFFPHGVGHMLGLDVHDMENFGEDKVGYNSEYQRSDQFGLSALRLAKPLEEGFVLTVEPGLYFIPELISQWKSEQRFQDFICYDQLDAYTHFGGVRIEDNVRITKEGSEVLSKDIPKSIEEIEALRGE